MDGDTDGAHRLVDQAEALTAVAAERPEDEPPWVYFHDAGRVLFARGVVDLELGRHGRAADLFAAACATLTPPYLRDRARYVAHVALAAARGGEVDRATAAGHEALAAVRDTGSAQAAAALHATRVALRDHGGHPDVRAFDTASRAVC